MSGGVPKRVWQGKMQTKTNQTGMKVQGNPSMIGRKNLNKRIIETRVNSRFVLCGGSSTGGWRCKYNVNGAAASTAARQKYCKQVVNGVDGVVCGQPQPLSRNLAGGVGHKESNPRLHAAQANCGGNPVKVCKGKGCGNC